MAARAGKAPWSTGFKRLKDEDYAQGFIPGHGFLAAGYPDKWTGKEKKPKGRWLTDAPTGVKYYVTSKDIEALIRTSNSLDESGNYKYVPDTLFMQFIAEHNLSAEKGMTAYIEESFSGNGKGKIWSTDGIGHILQLEYNDYTQVMRVHFSKGAICVYFRVPMVVFGELYTLAQNKTTTTHTFDGNERGALGVRFWDLVRIRGSMHGGRFRFVYEQENGPSMSDYIPSANDRGRPQKYFLVEDTKDARVTLNKLKELDPSMYNNIRSRVAQLSYAPFAEAFAAEKGKIDKPKRKNITNFEIESELFDTSDWKPSDIIRLNKMDRAHYLYDNEVPKKVAEGYAREKKNGKAYTFEPDEKIMYRDEPVFESIIQPGSVAGMRLSAYRSILKQHKDKQDAKLEQYRDNIAAIRTKLLQDPTIIAERKAIYAREMDKANKYLASFKPDATQEAKLTKTYMRKVPIGSIAEDDYNVGADYLNTLESIYGVYNMKMLKQSINKNGFNNFLANATDDDGNELFETPVALAYLENKYKNKKDAVVTRLQKAHKEGYAKLSTSGKNTYNSIKGDTQAETDFLREYYLAKFNLLPKDYFNIEHEL